MRQAQTQQRITYKSSDSEKIWRLKQAKSVELPSTAKKNLSLVYMLAPV
jgi:hypothetical protein